MSLVNDFRADTLRDSNFCTDSSEASVNHEGNGSSYRFDLQADSTLAVLFYHAQPLSTPEHSWWKASSLPCLWPDVIESDFACHLSPEVVVDLLGFRSVLCLPRSNMSMFSSGSLHHHGDQDLIHC